MNVKRKRDSMEDIFEEMNEIIQRMLGSRSMEEPLVWGFSLSQRGDDPPEIHEFGNVNLHERMEDSAKPGTRKPLIDILEAEDTLHVVVEMPGVAKEDISLDSNGTTLDIKAASDDRKYAEHVDLPARVLPDSAKATYKNGVLEVVFRTDTSDRTSIKLA